MNAAERLKKHYDPYNGSVPGDLDEDSAPVTAEHYRDAEEQLKTEGPREGYSLHWFNEALEERAQQLADEESERMIESSLQAQADLRSYARDDFEGF